LLRCLGCELHEFDETSGTNINHILPINDGPSIPEAKVAFRTIQGGMPRRSR